MEPTTVTPTLPRQGSQRWKRPLSHLLTMATAGLLLLSSHALAATPKAPTKAAKAAKAAKTPAKKSAYQEKAFIHKSYDGFQLPARWMLPKGKTPKSIDRVVILIHGSGPQSMDLDLTQATKGKKQNKVFRYLGAALVKKSFGVLRYDKRTYVLNQAFRKQNPKAKAWLNAFKKKPLSALIEDAKSFISLAKKQNPKAKVYLLGVSQGTYVGLQAAHKNPQVAGVGLIGFYTGSMMLSLSYVQVLYRPILMLRKYDTNGDNALDDKELTKAGKIGISLGMQFSLLDADKDKKLSWVEIQGGNMLALFRLMKSVPKEYLVEEVKYPSVVHILRKAKFKVAFFQGMYDNQTPASHTIGIQLANKFQWKKPHLQFHLFPKLGHVLDPRTSYHDLKFSKMSPKAMGTVCDVMNKSFK